MEVKLDLLDGWLVRTFLLLALIKLHTKLSALYELDTQSLNFGTYKSYLVRDWSQLYVYHF